MWIFNFIVAFGVFARLSFGQNCGGTASGAPPSDASKVAIADTVGGVTLFSASGCTLQITRAGALPTGQCNAQINGVSTCNSSFTIFIGNGTFRSFAGGSDIRPACFTDIFSCNQGISITQNSAGGGGGGSGGGGGEAPTTQPPTAIRRSVSRKASTATPRLVSKKTSTSTSTSTPRLVSKKTSTSTSTSTPTPTPTPTPTVSTRSSISTTAAPKATQTCDPDDDCCSNDDGCS